MSIGEILKEIPYLHPGEMPRHILDTSISTAALARDYNKLGVISHLTVLIDSHSTHVVVVDMSVPVRDSRVDRVLRLEFKESPLLSFKHDFKNVIQINKVAVQRAEGNKEIASSVYKMIVDAGYTLVSDTTQFDPAKALWKKLARATNYKMYIADIDHGVFKNNTGENIMYNGDNISDVEIWTGGSDFGGSYRVLILTK